MGNILSTRLLCCVSSRRHVSRPQTQCESQDRSEFSMASARRAANRSSWGTHPTWFDASLHIKTTKWSDFWCGVRVIWTSERFCTNLQKELSDDFIGPKDAMTEDSAIQDIQRLSFEHLMASLLTWGIMFLYHNFSLIQWPLTWEYEIKASFFTKNLVGSRCCWYKITRNRVTGCIYSQYTYTFFQLYRYIE